MTINGDRLGGLVKNVGVHGTGANAKEWRVGFKLEGSRLGGEETGEGGKGTAMLNGDH